MYFFNIDGIKHDLKQGRLSDCELLKYLYGYIIVSSISEIIDRSTFQHNDQTNNHCGSSIGIIIGTIVFLFFLNYCYKKNGGKEGVDFFHRLLPLFWVLSFRLSFVLIGSFFLLLIISHGTPSSGGMVVILVLYLLFIVFFIIGFWFKLGQIFEELASERLDYNYEQEKSNDYNTR